MKAESIGLAEAAQLLRMPYQEAHNLVMTGVLRAKKRKGRWWVRAQDVDRLASSHERDGGDPLTVENNK